MSQLRRTRPQLKRILAWTSSYVAFRDGKVASLCPFRRREEGSKQRTRGASPDTNWHAMVAMQEE